MNITISVGIFDDIARNYTTTEIYNKHKVNARRLLARTRFHRAKQRDRVRAHVKPF